MIATQQTQSLDKFRKNVDETLQRLSETGETEFLTVDGEVAAVLVPPVLYTQLLEQYWLRHDIAAIKRSEAEYEQGKGMDAFEAMAQLRAKYAEMKEKQSTSQK